MYDDDMLDPEGPSAADLERFDRETRVCEECGLEISDLVSVCPECGEALYDAPARSGRSTVWWRVVGAVTLIAVLMWFVF